MENTQNSNEKLQQLLDRIEAESGIALCAAADAAPDADAVERLAQMLRETPDAGTKMPLSRNALWQRLLDADASPEEIADGCTRLLIGAEDPYEMILIDFPAPVTASAWSVLEGMQERGLELVRVKDRQVVLLTAKKKADAEETIAERARTLSAMLDAEAMQLADIVFDAQVYAASALSAGYRYLSELLLAGRDVDPAGHVYDGARLGLAWLVRRIPKADRNAFRRRFFGTFDPAEMDEETRYAVEAFLRNGLSISDTAREIFVHRNTLVYRLDKFQRLSGLDVRQFSDALLVYIGLILG